MNDGKFEKVADSYSEMFYYSPYYTKMAEFLEEYLGSATYVMEIGAADGIVATAWNKLREASGNDAPLTYFAVEPVERMVHIAQERTEKMTMTFCPIIGDIKRAADLAQIQNVHIDGLIMSRVLHEIFIQHDLDHEKLFADMQRIIEVKRPKTIILGVVNRYSGLNPEDTQRFIEEQTKKIGHGHDPAKEYIDQSLLDVFMHSQKYTIVDRAIITQPLHGFDPSPWGETITVYQLC